MQNCRTTIYGTIIKDKQRRQNIFFNCRLTCIHTKNKLGAQLENYAQNTFNISVIQLELFDEIHLYYHMLNLQLAIRNVVKYQELKVSIYPFMLGMNQYNKKLIGCSFTGIFGATTTKNKCCMR